MLNLERNLISYWSDWTFQLTHRLGHLQVKYVCFKSVLFLSIVFLTFCRIGHSRNKLEALKPVSLLSELEVLEVDHNKLSLSEALEVGLSAGGSPMPL